MANLKVTSSELRNDGVKLEIWVFPSRAEAKSDDIDNANAIDHFEIVLNPAQIIEADGMDNKARKDYIENLIQDTPRIKNILIAEQAMKLMEKWYEWPQVFVIKE